MVARFHIGTARSEKMERAVLGVQIAPGKPQQTVTVGMGVRAVSSPSRPFSIVCPPSRSLGYRGGRSSTIPNPNARWRPTPRCNSAAKAAGSATVNSPRKVASGFSLAASSLRAFLRTSRRR